jgi:hypothetical protein
VGIKNNCYFCRQKEKEYDMSIKSLHNLRDYLCDTLTPANMIWLSTELAEYAKREEVAPRPYTMGEINAMLDKAEANFEAGQGTPHEEVMRELRGEFAAEELEMA